MYHTIDQTHSRWKSQPLEDSQGYGNLTLPYVQNYMLVSDNGCDDFLCESNEKFEDRNKEIMLSLVNGNEIEYF